MVRLRRGWYASPGAPEDVVAAVRAGGVLACVSALALHGVWTLPVVEPHVRIPWGCTTDESPVHRHRSDARLPPGEVVDHPAVALETAARCLPLDDLVVVVDSMLNRGMLPRRVIEAILVRTIRGRRALSLSDSRAESGLETLARIRLRRLGVAVRPQVEIPAVGRVDLLVGERLVIELDGDAWHSSPRDRERDRRRDRSVVALGGATLHFGYRDVVVTWEATAAEVLAVVRRDRHRRRTLGTSGVRGSKPLDDPGDREL